jgi:hypothetical protein
MPHPHIARSPLALTVVVPAIPERPPGRGPLRHRPTAVRTGPRLDHIAGPITACLITNCLITAGPVAARPAGRAVRGHGRWATYRARG